MVNKEMAMVIYNHLEVSIECQSSIDTAQEVVNTAWKRFDALDESTWPEEGAWCYTQHRSGGSRYEQFLREHWWPHTMSSPVVRYADPDDLSFKEI